MDRAKKPTAIGITSTPPQPTISLQNNIVQASLPTGESVTVNLYGATVTSWKTADGAEKLWLSDAAVLDGSKPIRGGIPVVFPVFGPPPQNHATTPLPQHGFARNSLWEFLGKSSSESSDRDNSGSDDAVKLDFGLATSNLTPEFRSKWGYEFGLVYSVTLSREGLGTSLQVQNQGKESFEFQVLLHTYFAIEDINSIRVKNLNGKTYIDKVQNASEHTESAPSIAFTSETDRVYKDLDPAVPLVISDNEKDLYSITREGLNDAVVWNPWIEKAKSMGDFSPDEGYKKMVCVEAGAVNGWQALEAGESWEGGQFIRV
ncbi:galactose mutarotase-like domain-containing protein [Aspergillus karnatakaensis]|uniref:D-hexose-6-phosphate mutarotase n=1 Tax=Aspergillus karnatakaensis TaxID=1810916 RepID=UPI003CCD181A